LFSRELEVRRRRAHVGVDVLFELGKILCEHANTLARGLAELDLVDSGL
jgi:hypothetical protein